MTDQPGGPQTPPPQDHAPEPVPPALLGKALEKMRQAVRGNGAPAASVTIKSSTGGILDFEACQIFRIGVSVSEKYVNGKQQGRTLSSEAELRREIQRLTERAPGDPSLQQSIRDALRKRPDLGFAQDRHMIQLSGESTQYIVHIECGTCNGTKASPCLACRGTGKSACTKCKGRREITCPDCRGAKTVQQSGNSVSCNRCRGRGRISCPMCRQTGQMPCPRCRGAGKMSCQACGGAGWRSLIASMTFKAEGSFDYDRRAMPEGVAAAIDRLKGDIVTARHADIRMIDDPARLQEVQRLARPGDFVVPYRVRLPFAEIAFDIRGQEVQGKLFGQQPLLTDMPAFLERLTGRGLNDLAEAAKSKNAAAAKLTEAIKYRLVADIVMATASNGQGKAAALLHRRYPLGVRDFNLKHLVRQADVALKNLTRMPRLTGLGAGLALTATLDGIWFVGPLRAALLPKLGPATVFADLLLLAAGGAVTALGMQLMAVRTIHRVVGHLRKENKKKLMPKLGRSLVHGYAGAAMLFLLALQASVMLTNHPPDWYLSLLHLVKLH